MTSRPFQKKHLKRRWPLHLLALTVVVDFFYGGLITFPIVRALGGSSHLSGTLTLLFVLVAAHAFLWLRSHPGRLRSLGNSTWSRKEYLLLALIAAFAAWSRFSTLDWEIVHGEDRYEGFFLDPVRNMLETGNLNHLYHPYPGFFYYMMLAAFLAGFVVAVGTRLGWSMDSIPPTYFLKIGRGLVAVFSFANVLLTYKLGEVLHDRRVGLLAAALVSFSFLETYTSQYIRPDVVLETFAILALLQFIRLLRNPTFGSAALAGVMVGAATAIKYTGFLLFFPMAVTAGVTSVSAKRRLALMGVALAIVPVTYAVLSPYSFLDLPGFLVGVSEQGAYNTDPALQPSENMAMYYTNVLASESVGLPALVFIFLGLARTLASPRRGEIVALSYCAAYLLFFFSNPAQFDRFLLPCLPVLAIFGARGLFSFTEWLRLRLRRGTVWVSAGVLILLLASPVIATWRLVQTRHHPSPRDEARAWMERSFPPGSRIAISRHGPSLEGLDFTGHRFFRFDADNFATLRNFDYLVSAAVDDSETLARFDELVRFPPLSRGGGFEQVILQVPESLRPAYRPVELELGQLGTVPPSGNLQDLADRSLHTIWRGRRSDERQRIDIDLRAQVPLGKIVLIVPKQEAANTARLHVLGSNDGRNYTGLQRFVLSEKLPGAEGWVRQNIFFLRSPHTAFLRLREPINSHTPLVIADLELFEIKTETRETGSGHQD